MLSRIINHFNLLVRCGKILKDLSERKGKCLRCGNCCTNCPYLKFGWNKEGKKYLAKCLIYNSRLKPYRCDISPTKRDLKLKRCKNCGYKWEK